MPALVTSIKVYRASTYTVAAADEVCPSRLKYTTGAELWATGARYLAGPVVREGRLGEPEKLTLSVVPGSPWHVERTLRVRQRLLLAYDDGTYREYRVRKVSTAAGEASPVQVEAYAIWQDLADMRFRLLRAPESVVDYNFPLYRLTVEEALGLIFDPAGGIDSTFELGTVETGLAATLISLSAERASIGELLRLVSEAARAAYGTPSGGCEFEVVVTSPSAGNLVRTFNFYREIGWSSAERTAGEADPSLRPIDAATGGAGGAGGSANLLRAQIDDAQDEAYTMLVPLASDGYTGIGGLWWDVDSVSYDGGAGETTIVLDDSGGDPIYEDGVYTDPVFSAAQIITDDDPVSGPIFGTIVRTQAPATVVVSGDLSGFTFTRLRFYNGAGAGKTDTGAGAFYSYVYSPAAEAELGRIEREQVFGDVAPYDNLFAEAGGAADMSTWNDASGESLPEGIENGGCTVTEVGNLSDEALYVRYGTRAARVEGGAGDYVQTIELTLAPTQREPWHTAWIAGRVTSGAARLQFVDAGGNLLPSSGEMADLLSDETLEIGTGGAEVPAGAARVRITMLEDATVLYLDALTATNSQSAWALSPYMGKRALYARAAEELAATGGRLTPAITADLVDLSQLAGSGVSDEIELGSWVRLRALWAGSAYDAARIVPGGDARTVPSGDVRIVRIDETTWQLQADARVESIRITEGATAAARWRKEQVHLARRRPSMAARFLQRPKAAGRPAPPSVKETGPVPLSRYRIEPGAVPMAQFQELVDHVAARGGGVVLGDNNATYVLGPTPALPYGAEIKSGVHVEGLGPGTVFEHDGQAGTYLFSVNPGVAGTEDPDENKYAVAFKNFTARGRVDLYGGHEHTHLFNLNGASDLLFERVRAQGWRGDAIYSGSGNVGYKTFTADAGADVLTVSGYSFANGTRVRVFSSGTLPGGLSAGAAYYVVQAAGTDIKLSLSEGGAAVDVTSAGSGTHAVYTERNNRRLHVVRCGFDGQAADRASNLSALRANNRNAISIINGIDVTVRDSWFKALGSANMPGAIDVEPDDGPWYQVGKVLIDNCDFEDIGGFAGVISLIFYWANYTAKPDQFRITNNRLRDVAAYAYYFSGRGARSDSDADWNLLVQGNRAKGGARPYALLGVKGAAVLHNHFEAFADQGFLGFHAGDDSEAYGCLDIDFDGNTFRRCATSGGAVASVQDVRRLRMRDTFQDCGEASSGGYALQFDYGASENVDLDLTLVRTTVPMLGVNTGGPQLDAGASAGAATIDVTSQIGSGKTVIIGGGTSQREARTLGGETSLGSGKYRYTVAALTSTHSAGEPVYLHRYSPETNRFRVQTVGYSALHAFEALQSSVRAGKQLVPARTPESYPEGVWPEYLNGAGGPDAFSQGNVLTFVAYDLAIDSGYDKFIMQLYFPAGNGVTEWRRFHVRVATSATTWSDWEASNDMPAALGWMVDGVRILREPAAALPAIDSSGLNSGDTDTDNVIASLRTWAEALAPALSGGHHNLFEAP